MPVPLPPASWLMAEPAASCRPNGAAAVVNSVEQFFIGNEDESDGSVSDGTYGRFDCCAKQSKKRKNKKKKPLKQLNAIEPPDKSWDDFVIMLVYCVVHGSMPWWNGDALWIFASIVLGCRVCSEVMAENENVLIVLLSTLLSTAHLSLPWLYPVFYSWFAFLLWLAAGVQLWHLLGAWLIGGRSLGWR